MFKWKINSSLGIDIQAHRICVTHLSHTRSKQMNIQVESIALPEGAIADGLILHVEPVVTSLTQLLSRLEKNTKKVTIAIPAFHIMSQRIQMSRTLKPKQYYSDIIQNLHRYFPNVTDDICFDFIKRHDQSIVMLAVRKEYMQPFIQVIEQSGLSVAVVDIDMYALIRALQFCMQHIHIEAILDLSDPVRFFVFQQNEIIFYQSFTLNHGHVIQSLNAAWQSYCKIPMTMTLQSLMVLGNGDPRLLECIEREWRLKIYQVKLPNQLTLDAMISFGLALRGWP